MRRVPRAEAVLYGNKRLSVPKTWGRRSLRAGFTYRKAAMCARVFAAGGELG